VAPPHVQWRHQLCDKAGQIRAGDHDIPNGGPVRLEP